LRKLGRSPRFVVAAARSDIARPTSEAAARAVDLDTIRAAPTDERVSLMATVSFSNSMTLTALSSTAHRSPLKVDAAAVRRAASATDTPCAPRSIIAPLPHATDRRNVQVTSCATRRRNADAHQRDAAEPESSMALAWTSGHGPPRKRDRNGSTNAHRRRNRIGIVESGDTFW
jgi:hypothetical protein